MKAILSSSVDLQFVERKCQPLNYNYGSLNIKMSTAEYKCKPLNIKISTVEHKCKSLDKNISTVEHKCESKVELYYCLILNSLCLNVFKSVCWTHQSQLLNFAANK